ncbi:MAG TPA: TIGR04219 family outer membrane beta-barrel protein [Deltaproteobacteria bacterium]|nr:TIGR04219 family outer membrane beta-barrel protein [Deltaproteobacteria bacterium]
MDRELDCTRKRPRHPLSRQLSTGGKSMRVALVLSFMLLFVLMPALGFSLGFEVALTTWKPVVAGDLSYRAVTDSDTLDLDDTFDLDSPWRLSGRAKLDLPVFPNLYLMATPMDFSGTGALPAPVSFGATSFPSNTALDASLALSLYDVGLYYGIPFIGIATLGILNCDVGVNARMIDLRAEIKEVAGELKESKELFAILPLVYGSVQVYPMKHLSIELEGRGVFYGDYRILSMIGRIKVRPFFPVFVAGGYRSETIIFDYRGIDIDVRCQGPFVEAGVQW